MPRGLDTFRVSRCLGYGHLQGMLLLAAAGSAGVPVPICLSCSLFIYFHPDMQGIPDKMAFFFSVMNRSPTSKVLPSG